MCVCVHVCANMCAMMCVSVCVCAYTYMRMNVCVYACVVCVQPCACACVCAYQCMCADISDPIYPSRNRPSAYVTFHVINMFFFTQFFTRQCHSEIADKNHGPILRIVYT